jgi:transposase
MDVNPIHVGVYIGKNVFQIHYIEPGSGEIVNKPLKRANFLEDFANLESCLIGMEACGGSQHWARSLSKLGHKVSHGPALCQSIQHR